MATDEEGSTRFQSYPHDLSCSLSLPDDCKRHSGYAQHHYTYPNNLSA